METVVIAYLAAFAAGRAKRLAGRIGQDAATQLDETLYSLYARLARRVPALRSLYENPDDRAVQQQATRETAWALQDEQVRAQVQQLVAQADTLSRGLLIQTGDVRLSAGEGGVAANQVNAPVSVDNRWSHATYHDDQGFHELHESSGAARALMVFGLVVAMIGMCVFFYGIYSAAQAGASQGVPAGIAVGFGMTFVGILLANFGRMLHAVRR